MQRYFKPTNLDTLFRQSQRFSDIWKSNLQTKELNEILDSALSQSLRDHTEVAHFKNGTLLIYVNNPIWADSVRLHESNILEAFRTKSGLEVKKISVLINASDIAVQKKPPMKTHLSAHTIKSILDTAEGIDDTGLKNALNKLATRAASQTNDRKSNS